MMFIHSTSSIGGMRLYLRIFSIFLGLKGGSGFRADDRKTWQESHNRSITTNDGLVVAEACVILTFIMFFERVAAITASRILD